LKLRVTDKVAVLSITLVIVTTVMMAALYQWRMEQALVDQALQQVDNQLGITSRYLHDHTDILHQDTIFLSRLPAVRDIMRQRLADPAADVVQWQQRLAGALASFLQQHPAYLSARYIGMADNGRELVRVARSRPGGELHLSPPGDLKLAGFQRYVVESSRLKPGEFYFSDIEPMDNGTQDSPRVLRMVVPVHDAAGVLFGLIVVTVDFDRFLPVKQLMAARDSYRCYVADSNGKYLYTPPATVANDGRMQDDFPVLNNIFSSVRDQDVETHEYRARGEHYYLKTRRLLFDQQQPGRFITLLVTMPKSALVPDETAIWRENLLLVSVLLLLAVAVAMLFATLLTRPLKRLTGAIRNIDPEAGAVSLPLSQRGDEIGDLARLIEEVTARAGLRHQQLKESEQRLAAVFNNVLEGIVTIDSDGNIESVNDATLEIFGYSREELIGQNVNMLMASPYREQHDEYIRRYQRTGQARIIGTGREVTGMRKNGEVFSLDLEVTEARFNGHVIYTGILRDISERKATEVITGRLGRILDESNNEIFVFDTNTLRFIQVNRGARENIGYTMEELRHMTPLDIKPYMELQAFEDILAPLRSGKQQQVQFETTHRRKDGTEYPVEIRLQAFFNETPAQFVALSTDISERKQQQQALMEAKALAESANQAKTDFLSRMSHELRTPLNAILGFSQLMEIDTSNLSEQQRDHIAQIMKAGWHLLDLINDILDLSRIEQGRLQVSMEPVEVRQVALECITLVDKQAAEQHITIDNRLPEGKYVYADRVRLKQILLNLMSNAVKYNRNNGSVTLSLSERPDHQVRIDITDTGIGIPHDVQHRLFNAFDRLDVSGVEGVGIGLVISRRMAELMNGSLGFSSEAGRGSTFWCQLPLSDAVTASSPARKAELPEQPVSGQQACKLLYVEDNPANLELVRKIIQQHSQIRFLSADTGEAGLQIARREQPDIILLDINLPGMSGFDVLRRLQQDDATRHVPVVALSAHAMPEERHQATLAGFWAYLTKPVDVNLLMQTIDEVMMSRSQIGDRGHDNGNGH
jgi:PAS domain S-box-containing protein